jgi:hypothetical protein
VGAAIRRHQRVRGGEERKGCRRDAMKSAEKNKKNNNNSSYKYVPCVIDEVMEREMDLTYISIY